MPPRRLHERLADMLAAIDGIREDLGGMTRDELAADRKTMNAVLFGLIVIGEAAASIPDEVASLHPQIAWREARDLRNLIAHSYFRVDAERIWDTITGDLPRLESEVRALLDTIGNGA